MEAGPTACRGIRGAIDVDERGIEPATATLLDAIVGANGCRLEDLAAVIFSMPDDLPDANPAAVARKRGWDRVPLMLVREHPLPIDVPRCLRVLLLWNTAREQSAIRHVYLGRAAALRPDLVGGAS